jgi:hypothetical protein
MYVAPMIRAPVADLAPYAFIVEGRRSGNPKPDNHNGVYGGWDESDLPPFDAPQPDRARVPVCEEADPPQDADPKA